MNVETTESALSLRGLIQHICQRPQMFVLRDDFVTAATFIYGFAFGRSADNETLKNFREWLAARCYAERRLPRNYGWDWYIIQLYPVDADAFAAFPKLFDEFLELDEGRRFLTRRWRRKNQFRFFFIASPRPTRVV